MGLILAIVGGVWLLAQVAWGAFVANQMRKQFRDFGNVPRRRL